MRQNAYNVAFFLLLAGGVIALWFYADQNWFPKADPPKNEQVANEKKDEAKKDEAKKPEDKKDEKEKEKNKPAPKVEAPPPAKFVPPRLIALGGDGFYIRALLTTQGGAIQQIVLPEFEEADRLGRGVKENGDAKRYAPLYLIPGVDQRPPGFDFFSQRYPPLADNPPLPDLQPGLAPNQLDPNLPQSRRLTAPSYTLFHYPTPDDSYPDPLLGTVHWEVEKEAKPGDEVHALYSKPRCQILISSRFARLTRSRRRATTSA